MLTRFCDSHTSSCVPPFWFWCNQRYRPLINLESKLMKDPVDKAQTSLTYFLGTVET